MHIHKVSHHFVEIGAYYPLMQIKIQKLPGSNGPNSPPNCIVWTNYS